MNRRQSKWAAKKAIYAVKLAAELDAAWDAAHAWNARLDEIAALDADYDPNRGIREYASDDEFWAELDA